MTNINEAVDEINVLQKLLELREEVGTVGVTNKIEDEIASLQRLLDLREKTGGAV